MDNIEQMIKVQELIYSNPDKLESILTAIESVLSPTIGEGNTVVAPEEEKAPKPWWEDYKWGDKDVGGLFLADQEPDPDFLVRIDTYAGVTDFYSSLGRYPAKTCIPYTGDIKLHFKPWKAEEGKIPTHLKEWFAVLWQDGGISVQELNDYTYDELTLTFSPAKDHYQSEVVGYCNINFVNPITGE